MAIRIFNSMTREKEDFVPLTPGEVRMYVCGPTVYSLSHIGHARSAVAFDVIFRYLKYSGFNVLYARNYTDVDDKIIKRAVEEGSTSEEVAERNIRAFDEDMAALSVETPTIRPKATETMPEIIAFIEELIAKGFGYVVDGDVYYCVRRFAPYGRLSGKNIEELQSGARIEVDERKSDPLDFALWKTAKPGEPSWASPWGAGRPGWHIECSAMNRKFLGDTIDIHGGGKDLIFPHHENETAQSEAATGKPFARYWLHNGFVNIEKEKMSKSLGNILNIRDALREYSAEAVRLFLLSSHYRSPIDYSADNLKDAESALGRYCKTLQRIDAGWPSARVAAIEKGRLIARMAPILKALDDDFNTAVAVGEIFKEISEANRLMDSAEKGGGATVAEELALIRRVFDEAGRILGVFGLDAVAYLSARRGAVAVAPQEIERLIAERNAARKGRDFARADAIRDELKGKGVILEDTPGGTTWTVG